MVHFTKKKEKKNTLHADPKKERRDSENMNAGIKYTYIFFIGKQLYIVHIIHTHFTFWVPDALSFVHLNKTH